MTTHASPRAPHRAPRRAPDRGGYSLIELVVVITIFILVSLVAVPAISSLLYTSEQSLAENSVRQGLAAARDAAIRSRPGEDAAAAFFFEPGGRVSVVTYGKVGPLSDRSPTSPVDRVRRDVFAPLRGYDPVQLPLGWSVRGFAPASSMRPLPPVQEADDPWYAGTYPTSSLAQRTQGNWIFPENASYDPARDESGADRFAFAVRFEAGTGRLVADDPADMLLVAPSPETPGPGFRVADVFRRRNSDSADPRPAFRADQADDLVRYARRVLTAPASAPSGTPFLTEEERWRLVGLGSTDVVLARPLTTLAVYNEGNLARALGVRLDRQTRSLYRPVEIAPPSPTPTQWIAEMTPDRVAALNAWIEGRVNPLAAPGAVTTEADRGWGVVPDARLFTVHRYLGALVELTGTRSNEGVTQ